jgi:hypothetical protein
MRVIPAPGGGAHWGFISEAADVDYNLERVPEEWEVHDPLHDILYSRSQGLVPDYKVLDDGSTEPEFKLAIVKRQSYVNQVGFIMDKTLTLKKRQQKEAKEAKKVKEAQKKLRMAERADSEGAELDPNKERKRKLEGGEVSVSTD